MAARSVITNKLPNRVLLKNIPNPNEATTSSGKWIDGTAAGSATDDRFGFYTIQGIGNMSWQITDEGLTIAATTATGRGRAPSAPFENTTTVANINKYGIRVMPSTSYTFSYKAKGVNVLANSTRASVQLYNPAGAFVTSFSASYIPAGDSDWTDYSVTFTTGVSSCWLVVYPGVFTAGNIMSATFKDFKLDTTTPTTRTTATSRTTATNRVAVRDMGTALRFDGVDDRVVASAFLNDSTTTDPFTLSMWFNSNAVSYSASDLNRFLTTKYAAISFRDRNVRIAVNSTNVVGSAFLPRLWTKIDGTFDGTTLTLYINGQKVGTPITPTISFSYANSGEIGANVGNSRYFNGIIDEPRIWNRALTPTEIQNLYLHGAVPRNGLVGEYLFDEGAGTTALDTSGNGNHGTITGATYTLEVPLEPRASI